MAFVSLPKRSGSSVLIYASFADFPAVGIEGTFYYDDSAGQMYYWNGSAYFQGGAGPTTTDGLPEGTTNLYYTNARADARIAVHVAEPDPHTQYTTDIEAQAIVDATLSAFNLDDLADVRARFPNVDDILVFDGADWSKKAFEDMAVKQYTLRIDEASATLTYIGEALPGSIDADPVWRIKLINETGIDSIKWADGTSDFDKIWDDRATYTY